MFRGINKNMNTKLKFGISGLAASLLLVASYPALAATNGPTKPPTHAKKHEAGKARLLVEGSVTSLSDKTLVIEHPHHAGSHAITVTADVSTTFYAYDGSSATLARIKTGDRVVVLLNEAKNSGESLTAKAISLLPEQADKPTAKLDEKADKRIMVGGEVSEISSTGFTLTGKRKHSGTVNVTSSTKVIVPGKASATLSDIQNGAKVILFAPKPADKSKRTVDATLIVVQPDDTDTRLGGVLAAVNGNNLVIFTRKGEVVKVDASSAIVKPRIVGATISDLKPGHAIAVIGIPNSDGSLTAQVIGELRLDKKSKK